jgi:hypothetical protein
MKVEFKPAAFGSSVHMSPGSWAGCLSTDIPCPTRQPHGSIMRTWDRNQLRETDGVNKEIIF